MGVRIRRPDCGFRLCSNALQAILKVRKDTVDHTSLSLIGRAQTGSGNAWNHLATLYQPLIQRWLAQLSVTDADADDVVQEVMATILKELPKFEHNGRRGAFRSWLRTIAVNQVRLAWRQQKLRPQQISDSAFEQLLQDLDDPGSDQAARWNQQHDEHVVLQLLEQASTRFGSQTLQLFRWQVLNGCSGIETAKEFGVDVAVAYAAKSRVLKFLREEAGEILDDSGLL